MRPTAPHVPEQPKFSLRSVYDWFSDAYNVYTLAAATGIGGWVARMTPFDWATPTPWLLTFCSVASTVAVFMTMRKVYRRVSRWRNPSHVTLTPSGGVEAVLTVSHKGQPTLLEMQVRIVEAHDSPVLRQDPWRALWRKRGQSLWTIVLDDDDWAVVPLMRIHSNHPSVASTGGRPEPMVGILTDTIELLYESQRANFYLILEVRIASHPELFQHDTWRFRATFNLRGGITLSEAPMPSDSSPLSAAVPGSAGGS